MKKIIMLLIPLLALFYLLTAHTAQTSKPDRAARRPAQLATLETAMQICTVTALETLNLRKSDSTSSPVIAILKHNEIVTVLPSPAQDPWIKVQAQDLIGFLNSNYCEASQ